VIVLGSSVRVRRTGEVARIVTPQHAQPFKHFSDGVDLNINVFYVLLESGEVRLFVRDALELVA
jgi:hypothetical protein